MIQDTGTLPVVEEELLIEKRQVIDGTVEVSTRTESVEEHHETSLARKRVDVERVPVNAVVDTARDVRVEGDVTIVPVLEERLFVKKRLVLVEEVRIREITSSETESVDAVLRKQHVTVGRKETKKEKTMVNLNNENAMSYRAAASSNTLSAFFDSRSDAETAVQKLKDAGIPDDKVRFVPGYESDEANSGAASDERGGFWHMLSSFFLADDDRETYAEGLRRGGYLVSVSDINDADYETAHDILDDDGAIDIDERADQWRTEGWNSTGTLSASMYDRNAASEVGVPSTARTEDTFDAGSTDRTIPIVEENLRVGKRDVNSGSVRVRSYTVETPVSESLSLRDENVNVDRRPVDRALTDADRAFQDRTLSAEEHHEEAVVSKDARVVEEIGIRKTTSDRTETINDTVRKTEVDIHDGRSQQQGQGSVGQSQSLGRQFASSDIREHSEVVGSDGRHVGTVDHLDGSRIKLTKTDSKDGQHHFLGLDTVGSVDGNSVWLTVPAEEALARTALQ